MYTYVFQGTVKQVLSCGDHEGHFTALNVSGHFLVAGTDRGLVKIWDLSRRYIQWNLLIKDILEPCMRCSLISYLLAGRQGFTKDEICLTMDLRTWRLCHWMSTVLVAMSASSVSRWVTLSLLPLILTLCGHLRYHHHHPLHHLHLLKSCFSGRLRQTVWRSLSHRLSLCLSTPPLPPPPPPPPALSLLSPWWLSHQSCPRQWDKSRKDSVVQSDGEPSLTITGMWGTAVCLFWLLLLSQMGAVASRRGEASERYREILTLFSS